MQGVFREREIEIEKERAQTIKEKVTADGRLERRSNVRFHIEQEEIVSRSSDFSTKWLAMNETFSHV
jgi:DNA-directed RNA polymerase subunit E'/Rpb7